MNLRCFRSDNRLNTDRINQRQELHKSIKRCYKSNPTDRNVRTPAMKHSLTLVVFIRCCFGENLTAVQYSVVKDGIDHEFLPGKLNFILTP